jgi:ribose transport system permease protein
MTTTQEIPARRRFDWRSLVETLGPLLALAALVFVTYKAEIYFKGEKNFLKPENLINILKQWSFVGIVAIGMTVVIISGGIDLSVGALVAMAGGAGIWLMNTAVDAAKFISDNDAAIKDYKDNVAMGLTSIPLTLPWSGVRVALAHMFQTLHMDGSNAWGVFFAFAATILLATIAGWLAGVLIAKGRLAPFIATLGGLAIYRSIALSLADGGEFRSSGGTAFSAIGTGGINLPHFELRPGVPLQLPWPVIIFAIVAVFAAYLLNKTRFGRYVYAIGSNERAAVYSAVRVDRVKIYVYTLMGALCGVAALLLGSRMNSIASSSTGNLYELDAIAAVVIGGTRLGGGSGTIRGTVIGVLILGVISNMLGILDVSPYLQGTVKGSIIIAAVLLQQVGRKER